MIRGEVDCHTEYFPSLKTLSRAYHKGKICMEAAENFQKNSTRNRCYLTGPQGNYFLTVPLASGKNQQCPIKEVRLSPDRSWTKTQLKTLRNDYARAPFFEHYYPQIVSLLIKTHRFLIDLNWETWMFAFNAFHLSCSVSFSLEFDSTKKYTELNTSLLQPYPQLYENLHGFVPGLACLDLLFCMGPETRFFANNSALAQA
jgi:hypothetical protein